MTGVEILMRYMEMNPDVSNSKIARMLETNESNISRWTNRKTMSPAWEELIKQKLLKYIRKQQ